MNEWKNVWIWAEVCQGKISPTAFELLTAGRKLAEDLGEKLGVVLLGRDVQKYSQELIERGADCVYVCEAGELENHLDEVYAKTLNAMIRAYKPNKFLFPATSLGRSLSAQTAVLAQTGVTADALEVSICQENGQMHATKPAFGGDLMATITCTTRPELCSVRPMAYPQAPKTAGRKGEVIWFDFDKEKYTSLAKFLQFIKGENVGLDLSETDVIVAGGRGVGKAEGFALLHKLAARLGGAVAATRPPVDNGWIDYCRQIGITGRTVKPKLYIACGISGQVQHMAGCSGADVLVAINKDPEAPIMKMAHYAVEGDLYEVIPAMLEALEN